MPAESAFPATVARARSSGRVKQLAQATRLVRLGGLVEAADDYAAGDHQRARHHARLLEHAGAVLVGGDLDSAVLVTAPVQQGEDAGADDRRFGYIDDEVSHGRGPTGRYASCRWRPGRLA